MDENILKDHVKSLIAERDITLEKEETEEGPLTMDPTFLRLPGCYDYKANSIMGPAFSLPWKKVEYATWMHEIGHSTDASLHDSDRNIATFFSPRKVDEEVLAWKWALEHAKMWTPMMQKYMVLCLMSYAWRIEHLPETDPHVKGLSAVVEMGMKKLDSVQTV